MRADRLLAILFLLQQERRWTAGELAARLEVSTRTIYRDVEALGAAGVPVYAAPGRNGGIRLLGGYRTDLTGLNLGEAELLPLIGLSGVLAGVGLGPSLRRTEEKVLAALGTDHRARAELSRRRIHVDLSRWWEGAEAAPRLPEVAAGVLAGRRLRIRYRRGGDGEVVRRTLDPLGLVVQGGVWYLVGRTRGNERIYRVSRIRRAEVLDETVEHPDDFDLPAFWAGRKEEFHMTREGYRVLARSRPGALGRLEGTGAREAPAEAEADPDGWTTVELSFGTRRIALEHLLGLGPDVVVIEPEELQEEMADAIRRMRSLLRVAAVPFGVPSRPSCWGPTSSGPRTNTSGRRN